jgi:NAD(P)H-hydrate epimerase
MTILTPHLGEYARLTGQKREDIADTFVTQAQQTAHAMQCTLLLKNTPTIITDGKNTILNINGNPGMATAGSGDVLAGIIGSVAAQKIAPLYAASLGAYIHAMAGDSAATIKGQISLTASDIIKALPSVLTLQ